MNAMTLFEHPLLKTRLIFLYIFLFCLSLLGIAMYMENVMGLEPCPLCMTQRLFFAMAGLSALLAFVHNPAGTGKMIYGFLKMFIHLMN